MNHLTNRLTSVFLCHPNSQVIARELETAMAQCGLLPVESGAERKHCEVRLFSGAGMWHVLEVSPIDALWKHMGSGGQPFFQLLGKQLLAPGFAGITGGEDKEDEVFLELDAQGNMRASGRWASEERIGNIQLMQPIQPFSSGLKSLWAGGQTQAAIEGIKGITPVQAFMRMALHRLGGEQLSSQDDWTSALVYEGHFAEADPETVRAYLAEQQAQAQAAALAEQASKAAKIEVPEVPPDAPMAAQIDEAPAELDVEPNLASGAPAAGPDVMAREAEANDTPSAVLESVAVEAIQQPAQASVELQPDELAAEVERATAEALPEGMEEFFEHVYVDGQTLQAGDALAMDDGLSSARLQGIASDAQDRAGFTAILDVAGGRVHQQGGAVLLARAKCVAKGVRSHDEAEVKVIDWLQQRVQERDVKAMLFMGIRLLQGTGIEKDPRQAYEHLLNAAEHGSAMAQYLVGSMSKNPVRSARYWLKAAEQGHAPSWFLLGLAHVNGHGVPQSSQEASACFERAAQLGHLPSIYNLGVMQGGVSLDLLEDPDTKIGQFQAKSDQGNPVATWVVAHALMRSEKALDLDRVTGLLLQAAEQGFDPAVAVLVEFLASDELTPEQRESVLAKLRQQAVNSKLLQRVLGSALTQVGCSPAEVADGVGWLQQALAAEDPRALDELNRVKMSLLAHVPELLVRADQEDAATDTASLLSDIQLTAKALHCMVDGGRVGLGPNALIQLKSLYEAAIELGDASASEGMSRLQADPSWEQAQLLDQIARPWAHSDLEGLGQLESLITLPPPDEPQAPLERPLSSGHSESADVPKPVLPHAEQAAARQDGMDQQVRSSGLAPVAAATAVAAVALHTSEAAMADESAALLMDFDLNTGLSADTGQAAPEVLLETPSLAGEHEPVMDAAPDAPVLDFVLELDAVEAAQSSKAGAEPLSCDLSDASAAYVGLEGALAGFEAEAELPVSNAKKMPDAVADRIAQAKAQAQAEEEAMQTRLRDSLVMGRSDGEYESNLSEEDLAVLGAFKNMPAFDVLDTMGAPDEEAADFQSSFSSDTQGRHSTLGRDTAGPSSIMSHSDVSPQPQEQQVFEPENKKKSWWKFW